MPPERVFGSCPVARQSEPGRRFNWMAVTGERDGLLVLQCPECGGEHLIDYNSAGNWYRHVGQGVTS